MEGTERDLFLLRLIQQPSQSQHHHPPRLVQHHFRFIFTKSQTCRQMVPTYNLVML